MILPDFIRKNLMLYLVQAGAVALIMVFAFNLRSYDLKVPFYYAGDSLVFLMYIKGMLLNGWVFTIPQLSAPFEMSAVAFPVEGSFDLLIMKAISIFTSEPGLVLNGFWLLTLFLSAATSTIAVRLLGVSRVYAFGVGVLYAFLPYTLIRNVGHISLVYYLVPLLGLLSVHIAAGLKNERDRLITAIGYAACIAQGFNYIYYSFFAVLVFLFAAAVGYVNTGSRRVIAVAATAIGLTIGAAAINLSPSLYSWFASGKPPEMSYKSPVEAEIYGAKIRKLIAPHHRNPIPGLRQWGERDIAINYPNENENVTSRLGLAASVGFLVLTLVSLGLLRVPMAGRGVFLNALAALSLFTLLFITVGGFGATFNALFLPDIRAYNRFSVFLAFFALAALAIALDAWSPRQKTARLLTHVGIVAVFLLSLYDQLLDRSHLIGRQISDTEQYRADRNVAEKLDSIYPEGGKFLQFPLTGFPPGSFHERMESYDHIRPFLWSGEHMKWSWPSFSRRHRAWQERLAAERPQGIVETAIYSGFDAIWIDRYAYKDAAREFASDLEAAGAVLKLDLPRYFVLDLRDARRQLLARLGEAEFSHRREMRLEPLSAVWDKGFYDFEKNPEGVAFRWSSKYSKVVFFNDSKRSKLVRLSFEIASPSAGTILVDSGADRWRIQSRSEPEAAAVEFEMAPLSKTTLSFEADVPRVNAPGDPRSLYFLIRNAAVTERLKDAQAN